MFKRQYLVAAVFMPLLFHVPIVNSQVILPPILPPFPPLIEFSPPVSTEKDQISFIVWTSESSACGFDIIEGISVNQESKIIKIAVAYSGFQCPTPARGELGIMPTGLYQVMVYTDYVGTDIFDPETLALTTQLLVSSSTVPKTLEHETPAEGSIQSGVSLIRGWVCEANKVEASIDGGSKILLAYGTSREDTRANCGDANNGYGMVFNWGLLSPGQHNLRIFINDNTNIANVSFETVSLGESYVTGIEKQLEVSDFPAAGQSVILKWIEADQNFKIIQYNP